MTFDPKKPVQTRDGRKVRIICTDARSAYPIIALIEMSNGGESRMSYTADGTSMYCTPSAQLINVPERKTWWANVYDFGLPRTHKSRKAADALRGSDALGLVSLTIENGKIVSFENHPLDGGDDE